MTEQSAAIVPEPEPQQPREYRVIGSLPVFDLQPGETFTAELDPEQEARLIARGSIELVVPEPAEATRDELNEVAASLGVEKPERLPNKQAVLDAINTAREGTTDSTQEV